MTAWTACPCRSMSLRVWSRCSRMLLRFGLMPHLGRGEPKLAPLHTQPSVEPRESRGGGWGRTDSVPTTASSPRALRTLVDRYDREVFAVRDRAARMRLEVLGGRAWDVLLSAEAEAEPELVE